MGVVRCPVLLAASGNDHALETDHQLKLLSCLCPCVSFQTTLGLQSWRCVGTAQCFPRLPGYVHCGVSTEDTVALE